MGTGGGNINAQPCAQNPPPPPRGLWGLLSPWISVPRSSTAITDALLGSQHAPSVLISKPSRACFCALRKQTVISRRNRTSTGLSWGGGVWGQGCLPTFCLLKIAGLCLNREFRSTVCCKAHLDKLAERVQSVSQSVSPLCQPQVLCIHISSPGSSRTLGSFELYVKSCRT